MMSGGTVTLKGIIDEDFVNYKIPAMTLIFPYCDFKCDKLAGKRVCQNHNLLKVPNIEVAIDRLVDRYIRNHITHAWVFQGMEPLLSIREVFALISAIRERCDDDVVIYTGRRKEDLGNTISVLTRFPNIVLKYGEYIPDQQAHYDEVLGVYLASNNQYAERIS